MNWFDVIKEILSSDAGSFGFVLFVLLLIAWAIHKITAYTTEWRMRAQGLDKLEGKVEELSSGVVYIKTQLSLMSANMAGGLVQSHSPISLNEAGRAAAKDMGIEDIIANNWDKIFEFIDSRMQSRNAYDIQQFCIETATVALEKLFKSEDLNRVKLYAYNAGRPLGYYGGMIGVLIRDRYFKQKGIDTAKVDEYKP